MRVCKSCCRKIKWSHPERIFTRQTRRTDNIYRHQTAHREHQKLGGVKGKRIKTIGMTRNVQRQFDGHEHKDKKGDVMQF